MMLTRASSGRLLTRKPDECTDHLKQLKSFLRILIASVNNIMHSESTNEFDEKYAGLSLEIQKKFKKQLKFLLINPRYPSLQAKKYGGTTDIFQARVDKHYRFFFQTKTDHYLLLTIGPHPK